MVYKPSKLGNFAGGEIWVLIDKCVLVPVQLIRSVPSILSAEKRKIRNDKLQTVANQNRLDVKLNSGKLKRNFTVILRDSKTYPFRN